MNYNMNLNEKAEKWISYIFDNIETTQNKRQKARMREKIDEWKNLFPKNLSQDINQLKYWSV